MIITATSDITVTDELTADAGSDDHHSDVRHHCIYALTSVFRSQNPIFDINYDSEDERSVTAVRSCGLGSGHPIKVGRTKFVNHTTQHVDISYGS